jgi:hypothetical protein
VKTDGAFQPTEIASAAGGRGSSWHKLGEGPWTGTVFTEDGAELAVEEMASQWKVIDETGTAHQGRDLEQLLRRVLG